ncbi:MAG TPA: CocE/NonD family hydrolase [Dongiaceae bacterium]
MRTVTEFPRKIREIENVFIPLKDGTKLAARIWLPEDAEKTPVPAILEYLPYRKRDGTPERDALTHPYFAGHGYAGVRVDIRGTGESDGVLLDEYLKLEQDDCLEVLQWLAAQPWCTGACGMIGISWGGFNGLQVAARRPPELKAVISLCSTDDRYADDIHAMGGCMLVDNVAWASAMFAYQSHPPDPALVGERWREMWLHRLQNQPLLIDNWLKHQRRDDFWKHGSVCENFADITCAVYAVGGWADGYSNAVPRLLAGLKVPRKGLVGPWAHRYGHFAEPGPRIGFLQECLRWWDQWLKGQDTGIMAEPMYRVWMQDSAPARPYYAERAGRWVAEPSWPSPNIQSKRLALNAAGLQDKPDQGTAIAVHSPLSIGHLAGHWCSYGHAPDQPDDQREEDGKSVCFDSAPLTEQLEILGAPVAHLEIAADKPQAQVCVRLCDVSPDGESLRVSYGLLNLNHRESHEFPTALEPGKRYRVRVQLCDIAHAFPPGHRIRVAVSSSYWPIAWPAPEPVTLSLQSGSSAFELPLRKPRAEDAKLAPFPPAETATPQKPQVLRPARTQESVIRDLVAGETAQHSIEDGGHTIAEKTGLEYDAMKEEIFRIGDRDPSSARVDIKYSRKVGRGAWQTRVDTHTKMSCTSREYILDATLDAFEGDNRVLSRTWQRRIPRDFT